MKIIQGLLSCTRKNDNDHEVKQEAKTILATKLVNAGNMVHAIHGGIESIHIDATKGLHSCMKNASVEKRLQVLEPVLQKKIEYHIEKFNIEDKRAILLNYYSGKLNSYGDHYAARIVHADLENHKNNLELYKRVLRDAVCGLKVPQGLTEGGPSIIVDQVTDLYSKAGFSYSVRRKDEANVEVCNDVDRVRNSIKRVVDNTAGNIAKEFNTASPEEFVEKLRITSQEFEADVYNSKNGYPNKKRKLLDISVEAFTFHAPYQR